MVGRRKPLVLSSTKILVHSVLSSTRLDETGPTNLSADGLHLKAGILRFSKDENDISDPKLASLDDSALVGLSTSVLKRLSIVSGSLVIVRNVETKIQRIAYAVVLDPPNAHVDTSQSKELLSHSPHVMLKFPAYSFPQNDSVLLDCDVAYISPLLAFNLNLHISCLRSLVHEGKETLASLFEADVDDKAGREGTDTSVVSLWLEPLGRLPKYASHLRVSFVKIPECSSLESLRGISSIETEDRQEMIDSALHKYFEVDRYLAGGDVFSIFLNWNCNSFICIPCCSRLQNRSNNIIYFKVVAMEPSDEAVLRVNRTQTALVLGGSAPSAVPPDMLIAGTKGFVPLQGDTVKILASILTPPLCLSPLSLNFRVSVLLHGLPGCGKRTVVRYVAKRLGLHVIEYSCHNLTASSEKKTSAALTQAFNSAQRYSPTILLLRHFDVFRNLASHEGSPSDQIGLSSEVASVIREFTEPDEDGYAEDISNGDFPVKDTGNVGRHQVMLVAAADGSEGLPPAIRRCFTHEVSMDPLTEEQRAEMLSQSLQGVAELLSNTCLKEFVKDIVGQTSGFMPRDLHALIADAGANLVPRSNFQTDEAESSQSDGPLRVKAVQGTSSNTAAYTMGKEDLAKALERSKKRNASALGAPKVPNVKWEDVGGLEDVKKSILDTVQLPLLHKDLFSSGLRKRSGVLLYGPPGTGKARSARPCVIFFDELDSLAPARGASGDSGGVMDRVVSQMLAEIDGLNDSTQDLFIIGASNRPDLIDPALLRPGRFDKLLYVGVNSDASYRERVLKALTRKFRLHEDVSLYSIAKRCPPNFTGADMYALCADAWFHAAKRKVLSSDSDSSCTGQADSIVVQYDDFMKVLGELSPSLSMAELKKYEMLRDQFEGSSS
ncbi:PREDICTED: peroxisome biogenesis protein 6 isoform X2 [Theobroma cacao]|uniref:Peroxisome biogenesis protein 6 isoform X2 n=1 Tax=Theobroma cacao TaxID=3641 RepID=A0AB32WWV1_THECC|nr:PREDICTED: peroxisome biogenesis protein 6 isoform X2 [Theobroma cacao]